ncbi:DUF6065 family protein [Tautonia marina]|uniref:DUF6065 family protein n=1 Tax=Tautonia marina TaxID=2653855 RepID=UPI001260D548|nr:DUF6065 family protein [Tautonia marina]
MRTMNPNSMPPADAPDDGSDRPPRSRSATDVGAPFVVTADASNVGPVIVDFPRARGVSAPSTTPPPPSSPPTIDALPPFELRALRITDAGWGAGWELRPAPPRRSWMDGHPHAYHCLPLVVANQWGWQIHCPVDVRIVWDGSPELAGLVVEVDPEYQVTVKSQFGQGIVTFSPPWMFRTPPGWDLWAKGPVNAWKANCVPLEGIIETWWLPYTFTFNWKLVEPGEVTFAKGEAIGQILPVPHQTFAEARAIEEPLSVEPELMAQMASWRDERQRRAGQRHQNHLMYRKAQDVDGHLVRVPVPSVGPRPRPTASDSPDDPQAGR